MDDAHFDDFSRALGIASRRGALAVLGTTILGALVGRDLDSAVARRKRQHTKQRRRHADDQLRAEKHKKRRHKKKRRGHGGRATAPPPPGSPPSPPPPPPPGPAPCVGQCAATMACGADSCGGSCGTCAANETCQGGRCHCTPDCTGKQCGPDGCGGTCGSGCTGQETCDNGTCVCISQCAGKVCGDDGCGLQCGGCAEMPCQSATCTPDGFCAVTPTPGCCSVAADCAMGNPCMDDSCPSGTCQQDPVATGTPCTQDRGSPGLCNASGHCMECLEDGDCNDGNDCTANNCQNGLCHYPPLGAGSPCTRSGGGSGVCDGAGQCVRCVSDADCDMGDPCATPRCEPNSHTCAYAYKANFSFCGGTGHCYDGTCELCRQAAQVCEHENQCCDFYETWGGVCFLGFTNRCCRKSGAPCQVKTQCCAVLAGGCLGITPSNSIGTCA